MLRISCELGKYPDDVMDHLSMDQILKFAAFFHLQNEPAAKPESAMSIQEKMLNGAPD